MNRKISFARLYFLTILIGITGNVFSQISHGGFPATIKFSVINEDYPVFEIPAPDVERLLAEDAESDKYGFPMRFAECFTVDFDLAADGKWLNMPDGSRICRLALHADHAQAILLYYKEFSIPEGGKLFLYNTSKRQIIGAFDNTTNKNGGVFATEMVYGDKVVLEYVEPYGTKEKPEIIINEAGYVYHTVKDPSSGRGFGGSGDCEVNVNCTEGDEWQDQKDGVCRMIVKQGSSSVWCTGVLVNNTRQDGTPYLISADHCGPDATPAEMNTWIFYFRYEGPDCENPPNDTAFDSYTIVGASKIAAAGGAGFKSDFKLIKLNQVVPADYHPYFVGWNRTGNISSDGVTIHHPQGDIRKISTYNTPLQSTNWGGTPNTHWKVVWAETENGNGVTEGGSSGCPIFDGDGHMIGQLTGGDASCSNLLGPDYYGKFSFSWDKVGNADTLQLKPWLDPDNTGVEEIDGISVVGIAEKTAEHTVAVYPNPTGGLITIDMSICSGTTSSLEIFNATGQRIFAKKYPHLSSAPVVVDLTNAVDGIYFLKIISGKMTCKAKILKQKMH